MNTCLPKAVGESSPPGWCGSTDQLIYALEIFGAEKDEDGRILVRGKPPFSFMGLGQEMVVPPECECKIGNQWVPVAALLAQTSYGTKVKVIS